MKEQFVPLFSIASLYATDGKGHFVPVEIGDREQGAQTYELELHHELGDGRFLFEADLYEAIEKKNEFKEGGCCMNDNKNKR